MSKKKKILSKFMILYWAAFIAILGHMQTAGCRLDTPDFNNVGRNIKYTI